MGHGYKHLPTHSVKSLDELAEMMEYRAKRYFLDAEHGEDKATRAEARGKIAAFMMAAEMIKHTKMESAESIMHPSGMHR